MSKEKEYKVILFDEKGFYYYDFEDIKKAIKNFYKYRYGIEEADRELFIDLFSNLKKYRIENIDEIIKALGYEL